MALAQPQGHAALYRQQSYIPVTPFSLAWRYVGLREGAGGLNNPLVVAMLQLDGAKIADDETPWCSAFANWIAWQLGCARSRSLRARSWLKVGQEVPPEKALRGFHVVVLTRGGGNQPGPDVIDAPGHVGFFDSYDAAGRVNILGGNQGDAVTVVPFPRHRILGIREI
jgi:uncharacterized protein (TIGR02594 family)